MSKKASKRKVVVKTESAVKKVSPTVSRSRSGSQGSTSKKEALVFNRQNYILMGVGFGLVVIGLLLMSGGSMPDPNTWDPDIIYSFRRTTLAPIFILAGLIVEIYAIFKR
jgi:hypothetical protein